MPMLLSKKTAASTGGSRLRINLGVGSGSAHDIMYVRAVSAACAYSQALVASVGLKLTTTDQ